MKYYIVQQPANGRLDLLRQIAAQTLHDKNLFNEIFQLNKGRLEPGGTRMESPTFILPGWILVLPPKASGPGVHFGPLPVVTIPASPSPSPSASASPTVTAAPGPGRSATPVTHASASSSQWLRSGKTIAGGSALAALLLLTGLLILIRRRRGAAAAAKQGSAGGLHRLRSRRVSAQPTRIVTLPTSTPREPSTAGITWPYPVAPYEGLDGDLPDDGGLTWPALPAAASDLVSPAWPDALDDTGEIDWPDYLRPGLQSRAAAEPRDHAAEEDDHGVPGRRAQADGQRAVSPTWQHAPLLAAPAQAAVDVHPIGPWDSAVEAGGAAATWEFEAAEAEAADTQPADTQPADTEPTDTEPTGAAQIVFSPVALRILGAQRPSAHLAETTDMPVQELQVALGDDQIQVALAQPPAAGHVGMPSTGPTWLTSTPYLVWTSLPYDIPDDGIAFACLGTGDEGCLFIDLAAAPGAVTIRGDSAAAARLAESVAHQLCLSAVEGSCVVSAVGDALPEPQPAGAVQVASPKDLSSALLPPGPRDRTEVVFSRLTSNDDAFALARYMSSSDHRVVPVLLADLPDAPWSFTAQPSRLPSDTMHPAIAQ